MVLRWYSMTASTIKRLSSQKPPILDSSNTSPRALTLWHTVTATISNTLSQFLSLHMPIQTSLASSPSSSFQYSRLFVSSSLRLQHHTFHPLTTVHRPVTSHPILSPSYQLHEPTTSKSNTCLVNSPALIQPSSQHR